tara:strand:+ start:553 stop:798 length:246 start_codon:yes stop_codon:yes gene_type:complete
MRRSRDAARRQQPPKQYPVSVNILAYAVFERQSIKKNAVSARQGCVLCQRGPITSSNADSRLALIEQHVTSVDDLALPRMD